MLTFLNEMRKQFLWLDFYPLVKIVLAPLKRMIFGV